jgi:hypothetical protein
MSKTKAICQHTEVFPEAYFADEQRGLWLALHCAECDRIFFLRGDWANYAEDEQ